MRALLFVLLPALAHADLTATGKPPVTMLVGELTLQHTRKCANAVEEWVDPHHEIGFVRVVAADGVSLAPLEGKLVVAEGAVAEMPAPPVYRGGVCPEYQMRSDMVVAKGGMRRKRGETPFLGFRITRVKTFGGLKARRAGTDVEVVFTNELSQPLPITLTLHYEGCYGKPGTAQRTQQLNVRPQQSVTARFPVRVDEPGQKERAVHAASTVQVSSDAPGVAFVIDQGIGGPSACRKD